MWVRQLLYGLFLAMLVALPSAVTLGYYTLSGDPSFRPLAQSVESAVFSGTLEGSQYMRVQLRLHAPTQAQGLRMAKQMKRSLSAKGIDAHVFVVDIPAQERAGVVFMIRSNRLGPYPLSRASEGIRAAVAAYRMNPPPVEEG
ncbi:MAG: hypothetical protein JXQ91_07305 [Vannielia sp.]